MSTDAISFYWRPGCGFCMALERQLSNLGVPFEKLNIWEDPDAASFVRAHAGGNETVPTIEVGSIVMVNPAPDQVLAAMADQTPHLVPDDVERGDDGSRQGWFRRKDRA